MKRSFRILATLIIFSLTIVGCGSQAKPQPQSNSQTAANPSASNQAGAKPSASVIYQGATQMLSISADLKKSIDAGDAANVKAIGTKLEDAWRPFEDAVKEKYPELYKKVEDSLDPAIAGSKASPLDKQTLSKLNDDLSKTLTELAAKEK